MPDVEMRCLYANVLKYRWMIREVGRHSNTKDGIEYDVCLSIYEWKGKRRKSMFSYLLYEQHNA